MFTTRDVTPRPPRAGWCDERCGANAILWTTAYRQQPAAVLRRAFAMLEHIERNPATGLWRLQPSRTTRGHVVAFRGRVCLIAVEKRRAFGGAIDEAERCEIGSQLRELVRLARAREQAFAQSLRMLGAEAQEAARGCLLRQYVLALTALAAGRLEGETEGGRTSEQLWAWQSVIGELDDQRFTFTPATVYAALAAQIGPTPGDTELRALFESCAGAAEEAVWLERRGPDDMLPLPTSFCGGRTRSLSFVRRVAYAIDRLLEPFARGQPRMVLTGARWQDNVIVTGATGIAMLRLSDAARRAELVTRALELTRAHGDD
ncbi:MAG: hypothetical protein KC503_28955 [Myxococcales bacterium]|nr:hypothetical protein [Myxococcales bacterium]